MNNLRIIYSNAADRATSLAASTTAGSLVAAYMQSDIKGKAHRSTGTSVSYTLTWTDGETISGAGLPAMNLTADATARMRLWSDTGGTTLIADSGTGYACPGLDLGMWDWTLPLNANAFAYGGASKSAVWLDAAYFARRCVIDIVDTGNPAGYIDCSRLVIGNHWSPSKNADYGAKIGLIDTTESKRNDAGDLLPDLGVKHDRMQLDLKLLNEADRAQLMRIARNAGTSRNIFLSLLPGNSMSVAEQDHMIYGKRDNSDVSSDYFSVFSQSFTMEGW